ncbi:MAG TPA: putative Ig domain-containing protein [Steroidobacter sp.]|jgi:hypothetical protein|nr:putative Ig domain-containing protein [Steroidobacteraceae bacterium]HLS82090.1 putative Ig domain-containing protein [Steroidobacter sp.]
MRKSGGTGWLRRGVLLALTTSTIMVAGCGGGGGGAEATPPDSSPSGAPGSGSGDGAGNRAPTISAAPAAQVSVGAAYDLSPVAADPDGDPLAFSIENKPEWASFDTTSGRLSGTPSAEHVGAYANVVISVSDGVERAALPAFSIQVAAAGSDGGPSPIPEPDPAEPTPVDGDAVALSWDVPTSTVDGDPLVDLGGYRIHYGKSATMLTEAIDIPSAGSNQYVVTGLSPGTYYFVVRAVTSDGTQSDLSNVVSRKIG